MVDFRTSAWLLTLHLEGLILLRHHFLRRSFKSEFEKYNNYFQDEFGNYNYGYSNINSAKVESGNALTGVTGSYTVNDGHGIRRVDYVADALGFRPVRK